MSRDRFTGFKHDDTLHGQLTRRAAREGLSRSETIRRLVAYALTRMPDGWHPNRDEETKR